MAPGGEMCRLFEHFGENVLRHGSHEWLPYSKDEVHLKCSNTNLPFCRVGRDYSGSSSFSSARRCRAAAARGWSGP